VAREMLEQAEAVQLAFVPVMSPLCIQDGSNNSTWSGACLVYEPQIGARFRCGYEPLVHPGRLEQLHLIGIRVWGSRCGVRGVGFVFKAHRLLYHSTLGSRVIKKKKKVRELRGYTPLVHPGRFE